MNCLQKPLFRRLSSTLAISRLPCFSTYTSFLAIIMGGCYERQPIRRRAMWNMKKQCFFHCLHPREGSDAGHEQDQEGEHHPQDTSGGAVMFSLLKCVFAILKPRTSPGKVAFLLPSGPNSAAAIELPEGSRWTIPHSPLFVIRTSNAHPCPLSGESALRPGAFRP